MEPQVLRQFNIRIRSSYARYNQVGQFIYLLFFGTVGQFIYFLVWLVITILCIDIWL